MKIASDILRETKMDPSQPWGPPLVGLAFCRLELPPLFFPHFSLGGCFIFIFYYITIFLAVLHGMRDSSSPTGD